jgi:hypothetical protein
LNDEPKICNCIAPLLHKTVSSFEPTCHAPGISVGTAEIALGVHPHSHQVPHRQVLFACPYFYPSPEALLQMITGFWISQAIYAAAKLGIADLVKEGPKPCEELARLRERIHKRSIACCVRWRVSTYSAKARMAALA